MAPAPLGGSPGGQTEQDEAFCPLPLVADIAGRLRRLHGERAASGNVRFVEDSPERLDLGRAHSFLLQLHSPVLRAMLGSGLREAREAEVRVHSEFAQLWPAVVAFFYGLGLDVPNFEGAVALLRIANYYELEELSQACSDLLLGACPSTTKMALLAQQARFHPQLSSHAWSYLDAYPRELLSSSAWLSLDAATLGEFLGRDSVRCGEAALLQGLSRWAAAQAASGTEPAAGSAAAAAAAGGDGDGSPGRMRTVEPRQPGAPPRKSARRGGGDPPRCGGIPGELLDLIRFENLAPEELHASKALLPPEAYLRLLEEASGAVPRRRPRPLRACRRRPFCCVLCGTKAEVASERGTPEDDDAAAEGSAPPPECPRHHPGFLWSITLCASHGNRCPTCARCCSSRWSCCQMAETSIGCRRRAHQWYEEPGEAAPGAPEAWPAGHRHGRSSGSAKATVRAA